MSPSDDEVKDKTDAPINVSDEVSIKIRGGKREGEVEKIVKTDQEAEQEGVKNPPKVLFEDQHGHRVAHNPESLEKK
ncbi:hypothetical protein GJ744_005503 [Endocarpon pusillum]|uniref:Hypervirulence associated protein TUDOR domain-containing protein n=1 Tax=Endocarpon pusillum TaxID=364733 RepID=A0A8H7E6B8_9EURO|nr:hypothetical protein GJ744_005503 [Endocarpon pusillum]